MCTKPKLFDARVYKWNVCRVSSSRQAMFCMQQSISYSWNQLCPLCEKNISLIAVAVAKIVIPLKSLTHPFSVGFLFQRSTFVGSVWSFGLFIPTTTADFFYPRFYPLHLFSYLNSWERASIFPFECSVLNKGTIGTIFITSLVWRVPLTEDWTRDHRTTPLGYRGGGIRSQWHGITVTWIYSWYTTCCHVKHSRLSLYFEQVSFHVYML